MSESSENSKDLHDNETTNVDLSSLNKNEKCEISNELFNYRDILLKNQFDLKKKEEEVQGYAEKLTKIKSKVKSRQSTELTTTVDESDDSVHDISDAKTPSEKSLLLKKKLEENRKIFELRNKELNESKRAAEVQVEKILQQLNDDSSCSINIPFIHPIDDKNKHISDLNSKINELELIIIDLKDSLNNKDSVIESKTKAITLVTDKLSQKSKITLDQLEDTQDEMRHMQETFIATEEGLKININNLLEQLQERDSNIIVYKDKLKSVTLENDKLKSQIDNFEIIIGSKDKQIVELEEKFRLEEDLHSLINEKDNQIAKLQNNIQELNHNMIKMKAQNKSKLKNLQDRLDSYYKSSSSNEEEVNLVNKVAILEEEIGNLQLILVDFDEIKVANDDLKRRITELEDQLTQKTEEVKSYNNAIVALENQKFELIQELHEVKQELLALDSMKYVNYEEKEELGNQDDNKDPTNDVTQSNLELIEILNRLQNQVNVVLNEKGALDEKFNKLKLYLNNSNETLTDLKSEIINLKRWSIDQFSVIQKVLSDLDENQLESTKRNDLLDYRQSLSDKNRSLQLIVNELTNYIDIFKTGYEQLIDEKNNWNDKFFFKSIDTSNIEALENLNIINLLTDNSFIPENNSHNENDISITLIENLLNILNWDEKHIDNSKIVIDKLAKQLEKKVKSSEEDYHDKLLINQLTDNLESLSSNIIRKRDSLQTIINNTGLANEKFTGDKISKIIDKIQQKNMLFTLLFKTMENLKHNVKSHEIIYMLLDISIVNNFNEINKETINSIQILLKNRSVLELILSLIAENYVNEIVANKEKLDCLEEKISLLLNDQDKLKEQLKSIEYNNKYVDEIKQKRENLEKELAKKEIMMGVMIAEKMNLTDSIESIADFNNKFIIQMNKLEKKLLTISEIISEHQLILHSIEEDSKKLKEKTEIKVAEVDHLDIWLDNNKEMIDKIESRESENASSTIQIKDLVKHKTKAVLLTSSNLARIEELVVEVKALKSQLRAHESILKIVTSSENTTGDKTKLKHKMYNLVTLLYNYNYYQQNEIEIWKKKCNEMERRLKRQNNEQLNDEDERETSDSDIKNENPILGSKVEVLEQQQDNIQQIPKTLDVIVNEVLDAFVVNKDFQFFNELQDQIVTFEDQWVEINREDNMMRTEQLTDEIEKLRETFLNCERNLASALEDKNALEIQIEKKEKKLESMNEKYNENKVLRDEVESKIGIIESIEKKKLALENQLKEAKEINQTNFVENDKLLYEIDVLNQKLAENEQNYLSILNDKKILENEKKINDEKNTSINVLQEKIEKLNETIINKEKIIEIIENEKTILENQLKEKENLNQESKTKINQLTTKIMSLDQQLAEYDEHFSMVLNDKQLLIEQIKVKDEKLASMNELNTQFEQLNNVITNKEAHLESLLDEKNSLENELRQKTELAQDSGLRIDELKTEISLLLEKSKEYEDQIQKNNEKLKFINKLSGEIEELNQKLNNKHIEMVSAVDEKNILENQLKEKEQLYQDGLAKINELLDELDISQQQITKQKEHLISVMSAKDKLENELKIKHEKLNAFNELHQRNQQLSIEKEEQYAENMLKTNALTSEIGILKKQIVDYERDIDAVNSDKGLLEKVIMERNEQLKAADDLKNQLEGILANVTSERTLIQSLTTEKITLEEKLKDMEQFRERVDQLNREIVDKEVTMGEITKEKNILMEQLEEKKQLNEANTKIMEEFKKDTSKISWLKQELESAKKHNLKQMQKMKIIAANLKKKTNQCQECENAAKEFKEKWENEISEKNKLNMKFGVLELNLANKDKKIAEFDELQKKQENDLQCLKEKIEILESVIKNRVVQFNNLREQIVAELDNCKKDHLVDKSLKEIYKKILELGTQVKEIDLRDLSDWGVLGLLKSESEDLFSDSYVHELQENTGIDYNDKDNMFEFVASKIIEDAGTDRKDFKSIISNIAEKYVIIESLKFKNKKLIEIINSINASNPALNEQLPATQIIEPMEMEVKEESVETVPSVIFKEKTDQPEENVEEINQPAINLDDEEVWGWNEENIGASEFKVPICTPETQMQVKIAELEDKLIDLQDKKVEVDEELKAMQLKNKKLIKKLQEYKIQNYNLQQQLKLQSNSSKFNDLDYTIEEELKSQITQLETNLNKLREDNEKISTEKDSLLNKIEILTTTKDELNKTMVMKNNELIMQIQHLGQSIQSNDSTKRFSPVKSTDSESGAVNQDKCIEHDEKISKLEKDLNEILSENNELKALIDTYETELNIKTKELEKLSNQTEYSKLNFFNMLEESHNEKKECLDNLSDVFSKSDYDHASHQSTLEKERLENNELKAIISSLKEVEKKLNEKVSKLEQDLQEKKNEINVMELSFNHLESLWNSEITKRAEMDQEHKKIINKLRATEDELKEVILINETKIAEGKTIVLSLENRVNKLNQELQAKNEDIVALNSLYNDLKQIADEQLQKNNELQSQYEEIVNELKLKTGEFDQQYLEKEMEINDLEMSLKETRETLHSKTQELSDLEQKLKDLQNSSKHVNSRSVTELQTIELLESESLVEQEIYLSENNTHRKSTKEYENYLKSVEDLQCQLAGVNEAMTNVTELLNIRVQEVADLKQYIKKLEFDKMAVDNSNTELNSCNLKLNEKNQELTHHLNRLKEELDDKNQVILSLKGELIELQALHNRAIFDRNNQNLEIKSLKDVINNNEILIQNLETNVADRDTQISNVREELSDCHHKIEELSSMIFDLQNSMVSPETFNEKPNEIERLEETIKSMKEEHNVLIDEYEKKLSENTVTLDELKSNLSIKNEEIEDLKFILTDNTYPGMIQELQDKIDHLYEEKQQLQLSVTEKTDELSSQTNRSKNNPNNDNQSQVDDTISSELDAALYMLHQRDVRCEELTHELLQLLEERDTLQLRLSNAIKANEELKKYTSSTSKILTDDLDSGSGELASSSTTLVKSLEAKEDIEVLNQKLSQLHNVNYHRDIRLIDERESRHIQQMSVIPHKNTLNSSSIDSSAKIIDTNYTVSRDVQSQPNVLLNWLWGRSTPKVRHM